MCSCHVVCSWWEHARRYFQLPWELKTVAVCVWVCETPWKPVRHVLVMLLQPPREDPPHGTLALAAAQTKESLSEFSFWGRVDLLNLITWSWCSYPAGWLKTSQQALNFCSMSESKHPLFFLYCCKTAAGLSGPNVSLLLSTGVLLYTQQLSYFLLPPSVWRLSCFRLLVFSIVSGHLHWPASSNQRGHFHTDVWHLNK